MIEPIDSWEEDLWPFFDRLKSAMDKQDAARLGGTLDDFVARASFLFETMENLTYIVYKHEPVRTEWVYLTWKSSRGINQWYPDRDLPLRWRLAEDAPMPAPTAELVEKFKAKYQGWKDKDKANAKAMKLEYKKWEKALKEEVKKTVDVLGMNDSRKKKGKAK